jgi:pimeloyl-ACP methyl ester carboxylesterase
MLLWFLATFVTLAVGGFVYQSIATARDNRRYKRPGQMVNIGGRRLHMVVKGENKEQPTVILEAGMATFSSNWYWVQTGLATDARVVAYDRAGLGWSDPALKGQDAYESAEDLHWALEVAGIAGPYVVAGHSYGGLVVRAFTDLYPDEVVGMVLVDSSHPDQWKRIPASRDGRMVAMGNRVIGWLARLGIVRLIDLEASVRRGLPEQPVAEMKAILNQPRSWFTSSEALAAWNDRTRPRINRASSLNGLPLIVLSVTEQPRAGDILTSLQAELPGLSTNSEHIVVEGATHENLISGRENAQVVVKAIRRVLEAGQTDRSLTDDPVSLSGVATQ